MASLFLKNDYINEKQFSTSAIPKNKNEITASNDLILLSDSCVKRIKEIVEESGYLRVMVSYLLYENNFY